MSGGPFGFWVAPSFVQVRKCERFLVNLAAMIRAFSCLLLCGGSLGGAVGDVMEHSLNICARARQRDRWSIWKMELQGNEHIRVC